MKNYLSNEAKNMLTFFRESTLLIFTIIFFMLMSFGLKIFYYDISIDTEAILNNYELQMSAWSSIGRIGLVFTKKLLFIDWFNPYLANLLTYITFTFVCLFICYFIQRIFPVQKSQFSLIIIPIVFLTHPIFAEQFNFVLQSFEVALGILFLVFSLLFSFYYTETKNKRFALISILLCVWSFLTYQSLILFYIAGCIASFVLILHRHEKVKEMKAIGWYFALAWKYLFIFLISFITSQILAKAFLLLTGIPSSSYLSQKIIWGKLPASEVFDRIWTHIQSVLMAEGDFYNYSYLISLIFVVAILIVKIVQNKKTAYLALPAFLLLYLSPFFLTIFIGKSESIRAQMPTLQFVTAFGFYYIYLHMKNKSLQTIVIAFSVLIAFHQSNVTANLLFAEHMKYEEDVALAHRINYRIDSMGAGERSNYSLVILGKHEPKSVINIRGETLGHSYFEWDLSTKPGSSKRVTRFMRTLGYPFNYPTESQIDQAHSIANQLTPWPHKNSIKIINNNLIIVKLSE